MRDDGVVRVKPLIDRAPHFVDLLEGANPTRPPSPPHQARAGLIGHSLGSAAFVAAIERSLGRALAPGKRGRKPRREGATGENIKGKTGCPRNLRVSP